MSEVFTKRIVSCAQCGNVKPWARSNWVNRGGETFCSEYCSGNYEASVRRIALKNRRKGKKDTV